MPLGELVRRITAWVSLVAWAAASGCAPEPTATGAITGLGARSPRAPSPSWRTSARPSTCRYGWSHASAARDTARQTEEVTRLALGGGVFINYLFLALWMAEAGWWWRAPASFLARLAVLEWPVRAVFLLTFVNGAIVFAHGPRPLARHGSGPGRGVRMIPPTGARRPTCLI
jgi:hypothetical protein